MATIVLKFTPKGKLNEALTVEQQAIDNKSIKRKKDRETITLTSSGSTHARIPKLSELKIFRELANAHAPNPSSLSGQHNLSEGSLPQGKIGIKKAGRLRFRISSGPIFPSSRQPEAVHVQSIFKGVANNASQEVTPSCDTEKEVTGKTTEKTEDSSKSVSEPKAEDTTEAGKVLQVVHPEGGSVADKKSTAFKIFKNMAQQFDALQDLFDDDCSDNCGEGNNFDRTQNKLTLENMASSQGNFTRVRFIRRKVTEKEKKPKTLKPAEQLVAEDYY